MENLLINIVLFILFAAPFVLHAWKPYKNNWDYYNQLENRRKVIISALAGQTWMPGDDYRRRIYLGVVKIFSGIDERTGLQYLKDAVDDSVHWECFNVYSFMDTVLRLGDKLPADIVETGKMRMATHFTEEKGFTENHKLQYRTARYLFAQTWPDGPDYADGMTPAEGKKEAEEWIFDWMNRTVTVGQLEFDSVNYHSLYYLCMTTLYDFADDPLMKQKAWMMMQLLLADWAPEYLNGNWIGAHSREKYNQVTHTVLNSGVTIPFGYLFFGNSSYHPEIPEQYFVGLAAVQGFKPLSILGNIATDRTLPYVHRETKAPRRGFGINTADLPTWKYDYVTKDYALGSSYGDITAVENHRWDLTWTSENDGSTCFFINPSCSPEQLSKYFEFGPVDVLEQVVKERPYYTDPNKWVEGSPFEELFQQENSIIALYDIPETERNTHVNGFFSKIIQNRITDQNGWIFCQSDSIYFAVNTFTKGVWHEADSHYRLTLNNPRTGLVMEVAQISDYPSFDAFQKQIKKNKLEVDLKNLNVKYTNSRGDKLDFTHGKKRILNGKKIDFEKWPLFDGPFIYSKMGSKIVEIKYGEEKVMLDFNNNSVKFE